ncbi:hypothetical protein Taro_005679, partial [Colocasia esculenta]|nr:hypothetical protein [Colocasia esculenta]
LSSSLHVAQVSVWLDGFFPMVQSVPPAFWARYMVGVSSGSACSLVGPSGNAWSVDLVKNEAGLFFETGWKEFVHDHSFSAGEFLVFEYDGKSRFDVLVFDTTMCEKEAAYHAQPSQVMSAAAESLRKDSQAISKKNKKSGSSSSQEETRISRSTRVSSEGSRGKELQMPLVGVVWVSQRRPVTEEEIERALKHATSFNCRFRLTTGHYIQIIPVLVSNYFPKETTSLTLYGPCGNSWTVNFLRYEMDRCVLTAGWRKFALDNHLEEDDACVFEFIKTDEVRVHIFRVVDKIAPCIRGTPRSRTWMTKTTR